MMKPITWAVIKRFIVVLLLLTLLAVFNLAETGPAVAQEPGSGNRVYLPLIVKSDVTPTGLYAQMLQMVQQRCAATYLILVHTPEN